MKDRNTKLVSFAWNWGFHALPCSGMSLPRRTEGARQEDFRRLNWSVFGHPKILAAKNLAVIYFTGYPLYALPGMFYTNDQLTQIRKSLSSSAKYRLCIINC